MVIQAGQPVFKPGEVSTRGGIVLTPEQIRFGVRGGGGAPTRSIEAELAKKKVISGAQERIAREKARVDLQKKSLEDIKRLTSEFRAKIGRREFKDRNEQIKAQFNLQKQIGNINANLNKDVLAIFGRPSLQKIKDVDVIKEIGSPVFKEEDKSQFIKTLSKFVPLGLGVPGVPGTTEFKPISELITKPGFKFLEEDLGISKEDIATAVTLSDKQINQRFSFLSQTQRDKIKIFRDVEKGLIKGGLKEVEENIEKILTETLIFSGVPKALAVINSLKLIRKIPPNIKKQGARAINSFLAVTYLTSAGLRIAGQPTAETKGEQAGKILVGEVLPFLVGTRLGVKGEIKKELRKEIDVEINKLPKGKKEAFEDYMKQAELFGRYEPSAKNIKLDNIESIKDPQAQRIIRDLLKKSKGDIVVGGSVAQTGQINVQRKLGDMDLYIEKGTPTQQAKTFADALKKAGVPRVSQIRGQVTIEGRKAIEFHDIERLLVNIRQVTPSWRSPRAYLIKTPEGVVIQRIGIQLKRKAVAGFVDPKRIATGKFKKDLQDFKQIAEQLFKRAEINARKSFFLREARIRRVEKIFGKKISRKPIEIKKPFLQRKPPILEASERKAGKPFVSGVKKFKPIIKTKVKKIFERKSEIIRRAELKASQKPFERARPKRIFPPSQLPKRPAKPSRLFPPSQKPFKPTERKISSIFTPPKRTSIFPSQIPAKPSRPSILFSPGKKPRTIKEKLPSKKPLKISFSTQTTKRKPLREKVFLVQGYNVFVKKGGFKGRSKIPTQRGKPRFLKANINPLTKKKARDLGAWITDRTISQTFQTKRTNRPAKKPQIKVPNNYFKNTKRKWRGKIIKGKEQPIINKVVERRAFAIDSFGEKKKLKVTSEIAKLQKQARLRAKNKPIKLKSTRFKFKKKR